ncbi:MAG: cyclic nucleotide-binding domain-containing protein, partial [Deltaproteobacteria bacterium]
LLKAIAACKLILEIDPGHEATQAMLAELYAEKYGTAGNGAAASRRGEAAVEAAVGLGDGAGRRPEPEPIEIDLEAVEEMELEIERFGEDGIDVGTLEPPAPPPEPEPQVLPEIPLFSDLDREAFVAVMHQMQMRRYDPGDVVIHQGERGRSFFIVAEGQLKVTRLVDGEVVELARLSEGHFFGEMSLLSDAPRSATVTAVDGSRLFELDAELIERLSAEYPSVREAIERFYRQRLLSNLLVTCPLFRPFEKPERKALVMKFNAMEVPAGEVVVREGEPSGGLYVVLAGEVAVTRGEGFEEVTLARLGPSEVFGEMSLLSGDAARASVRALTDSVILRLPPEAWQELMMTHPQILEAVSNLSAAREEQNRVLLSELDEEGLLLF